MLNNDTPARPPSSRPTGAMDPAAPVAAPTWAPVSTSTGPNAQACAGMTDAPMATATPKHPKRRRLLIRRDVCRTYARVIWSRARPISPMRLTYLFSPLLVSLLLDCAPESVQAVTPRPAAHPDVA